MKQLWGCFKFSAILKLAMAKFLVDSTHYCTVMLKHWSYCALLRFKSVVEVPYRFRLQPFFVRPYTIQKDPDPHYCICFTHPSLLSHFHPPTPLPLPPHLTIHGASFWGVSDVSLWPYRWKVWSLSKLKLVASQTLKKPKNLSELNYIGVTALYLTPYSYFSIGSCVTHT